MISTGRLTSSSIIKCATMRPIDPIESVRFKSIVSVNGRFRLLKSRCSIKNGSSCYPIRCGRIRGEFPAGPNPLQLDSPCHILAKPDFSGTHLPFTGPFKDMLLTPPSVRRRLVPMALPIPGRRGGVTKLSSFTHSTAPFARRTGPFHYDRWPRRLILKYRRYHRLIASPSRGSYSVIVAPAPWRPAWGHGTRTRQPR